MEENVVSTLAQEIVSARKTSNPLLVGISGAQGTGKTTLSTMLNDYLSLSMGFRVATLHLDDYYLSVKERAILARNIHPLLKTRGVPGTHNINQLNATLEQLKKAQTDTITILRRFDKTTDDLYPVEKWQRFVGHPDVVLLEGWCIGAQPQSAKGLSIAVNDLERYEDEAGKWRCYVNEQLKNNYSPLFSHINYLIYLQIPSFEKVYEWRWWQEQQLPKTDNATSRIMNRQELNRFIAHFERITKWMMTTMPLLSDVVITVGDDHQWTLSSKNCHTMK